MKCERVSLPGGGSAIVCSSRQQRPKRCACGAVATLACDWKVEGRKSGTCDKAICAKHAVHVGENKDLCPTHGAAWAIHPANPANKVPPA